ncbi:MAG TPA: SEC-C metal-binding domain-containing protein [Pirellulales bacterium]|nr:SEC-C metal-binding domain-containing protein [Pirellulales bacterium]
MGAFGEAFAAYAKPLLDQTDGSQEDLSKALTLSQLCYNLALLPADQQDAAIADMQSSLDMDDEEFDDFRRSLIEPMIRRHGEMFPRMHQRGFTAASRSSPAPKARMAMPVQGTHQPAQKHAKIDRYAPCPCNSGKKYKFCCGANR